MDTGIGTKWWGYYNVREVYTVLSAYLVEVNLSGMTKIAGCEVPGVFCSFSEFTSCTTLRVLSSFRSFDINALRIA